MKHMKLALTSLLLITGSAQALQTSLDFEPLAVSKITTTLAPVGLANCQESSSQGSYVDHDQLKLPSSAISCLPATASSNGATAIVDVTTKYEEKLQIVDLQKPEATEAGSKRDHMVSR